MQSTYNVIYFCVGSMLRRQDVVNLLIEVDVIDFSAAYGVRCMYNLLYIYYSMKWL